MKLILCDIETEVVGAWKNQFERHPDVQVLERSILDVEADAVVNPANSFGFMDGGLALKFCEKFGFELQEAARKCVLEQFGEEMLVGQAAVLPTGGKPPFIIHAPTMRTPQSIADTLNVYLAARGVFAAVKAFNKASGAGKIETIAVPGMGTGTGKMHPLVSARQLRYAYEEAMELRGKGDKNLSRLIRRERKLKSIPGAKEDEE